MAAAAILMYLWHRVVVTPGTQGMAGEGPTTHRGPAGEACPALTPPVSLDSETSSPAGTAAEGVVSGLTKAEAEAVLDFLEWKGWQALGVSECPGEGFNVRFRRSDGNAESRAP
jgi:hypothetical protein